MTAGTDDLTFLGFGMLGAVEASCWTSKSSEESSVEGEGEGAVGRFTSSDSTRRRFEGWGGMAGGMLMGGGSRPQLEDREILDIASILASGATRVIIDVRPPSSGVSKM